MKLIIVMLLGVVILGSCRRVYDFPTVDPMPATPGKKMVSSVAGYIDPYAGDMGFKPLKNEKVLLYETDRTSSEAYVDSVTTDITGHFTLQLPDSSKSYTLTIISGIHSAVDPDIRFYARVTIAPGDPAPARIIASPVVGAPRALIVDAADIYGGKIPSADIYIYTSRLLATKDTLYKGTGSIDMRRTGANGNATFIYIPDDTLFLRARYTTSQDTLLSGLQKVSPSDSNLLHHTLILQ